MLAVRIPLCSGQIGLFRRTTLGKPPAQIIERRLRPFKVVVGQSYAANLESGIGFPFG